MTNTSRKHNLAPPEQLEQRLLLTVKVKFNPNSGLLKFTGDSAANEITLDGLATPGSLEVFINNTFFDTFAGVKSLKINLKDGNDKLNMSALDLEGNVNLKFGDGADVLDLDSFTQLGTGGNGPTHFGGFFNANFGADLGDFAEMTNGVTIEGDAIITGVADARLIGEGNSSQGEFGLDVVFGSKLTINYSGFGDVDNDARELFAINLYVRGESLINGSNNTERFQMLENRFDGQFTLRMDDGDDSFFINFPPTDRNEFGADVILNGGDGNDTAFIGAGNLFSGSPPVISDFETVI